MSQDSSMAQRAGGDLLVEQKGPVLWLTLNRPQRRNALTDDVMYALRDEFQVAAKNPALSAIVLTGAGDKAFCAGADLTPGDTPFKPKVDRLQSPMGELFRAVHDCPVPILARVNGVCVAGGFGLFGMCDMAVSVDTAQFGMPEVKIGLFPMQILSVLRDLVPPRMLNQMCMTGKPISAQTAHELGLLNLIVPADQLDAAVDALVADLVAVSPIAVRRGKYAMRAVASMSFPEMMSFTETALIPMIQTEDAREGLAAFNERRPPQWTGK